MKILYQDLLNFLKEKPSKGLLSDKLFQLGHEHEIDGDIFEMELTPNRGDCLSLIGLARDLNIFFGKSDGPSFYKSDIDFLDIKFINNSPIDCPKISFLEIEIDDPNYEYQSYLESYFELVGGNKTNFFTDISNYISYELGQPTHCFDSDTLDGDLVFDNKICNDSFETLMGSKINLQNKNCIFTNSDKIISLAGVMGGSSTSCSLNTRKVLVECAYFEPESIIGKSIKYNLNSDAAYKFERGVDIGCQDIVMRRFIKVVSDHANIKSLKLKCFDFHNTQKKYLPTNFNKINQILGTDIDISEIIGILSKLDFVIDDEKIFIPTHRHDIGSQNDLAEEIARIIGYNNIKNSPASIQKLDNINVIDKLYHVESYLMANGFTESINFPFDAQTDKSAIVIDNPLDSNKSFLRTSLKSSLVKNFLYNQRRQKESIKLYEISDIYSLDQGIKCTKKLGIIVGGRRALNYRDFSKKLDFQYLDTLLNNLLNKDYLNNNIIEIDSKTLNSKKKDKVYFVEIDLDNIPLNIFKNDIVYKRKNNFIKYKPVSEFPSSIRDISLTITNFTNLEFIMKEVENIQGDIIRDIYLFDFYKNNNKNIIKLGYRFVFQSFDKTLQMNEINVKFNEILKEILNINGVSIDGI